MIPASKGTSLAWALVVAVLVAPSPCAAQAPPPPPPATDTASARTHFERGVEFYRDADYKAAIIEFQRAYTLSPSYRVLYNIAETQFALSNYAQALQALQKYLTDGGSEIPSGRREAVEREISELRERVGELEVRVVSAHPGGQITVDDEPVGKAPLTSPIVVSLGRHTVTVSLDGYVKAERTVMVASQEHIRLDVELVPVPALPPVPVAPPPVRQLPAVPREPLTAPGTTRPAFWAALGTTAALTAGAIVTGVLALDARNGFDTDIHTLGIAPGQVSDQRQKMMNLAIASDILTGTAVLGGLLTLLVGSRTVHLTATVGTAMPIGVGLSTSF